MKVKDGGAMNEDDNELSGFIATSSELQNESEDIPLKIDIDDWDSESITDVSEAYKSQPLPEKRN
jgi:hypothetical protein